MMTRIVIVHYSIELAWEANTISHSIEGTKEKLTNQRY